MEKYMIFVLCVTLSSAALPQRVSKHYRPDYEYNRKTDAFYKLHIEAVRYWQTRKLCEVEGAEPMIPSSDHDITQVHSMFKKFPDLGDYVWVGDDGQRHDSAEEQPIIDLSPSKSVEVDVHTIGQCDVATRKGDIETMMCFRELPFICKVAAKDAPYDKRCGVYGKDYRYYSSVGSCYKIPRIPFTWSQAYSECQAEGAHLVVVNSEAERAAIMNLTNTEPRVQGSRASYFFSAGFRAHKPSGNATAVFKTIFRPAHTRRSVEKRSVHCQTNINIAYVEVKSKINEITQIQAETSMRSDQTLEEAGYSEWSENEPNNALGREYCGSIFMNNGKLNDIDCSHDFGFICEKEVPSPL